MGRGYLWESLHEEVEAEFSAVMDQPIDPAWQGWHVERLFRVSVSRVPQVKSTKTRNDRYRELAAERLAQGLCADCGLAPLDPSSATRCTKHLEQKRAYASIMRRRGMREKLEVDREGVAHHFVLIVRDEDGEDTHEIDGYIHTGLYPDGRVGEVFIRIGKPGDLYAMLDMWAIAFSMALQYGTPLDLLCQKFVNTKFKPAGATRNKNIARCTSLVDYVCRFLLLKYCKTEPPEEVAGPQEGEVLRTSALTEIRS